MKKLVIKLSCEIPEKLFKRIMKKGINPTRLENAIELEGKKLKIERVYCET